MFVVQHIVSPLTDYPARHAFPYDRTQRYGGMYCRPKKKYYGFFVQLANVSCCVNHQLPQERSCLFERPAGRHMHTQNNRAVLPQSATNSALHHLVVRRSFFRNHSFRSDLFVSFDRQKSSCTSTNPSDCGVKGTPWTATSGDKLQDRRQFSRRPILKGVLSHKKYALSHGFHRQLRTSATRSPPSRPEYRHDQRLHFGQQQQH